MTKSVKIADATDVRALSGAEIEHVAGAGSLAFSRSNSVVSRLLNSTHSSEYSKGPQGYTIITRKNVFGMVIRTEHLG